MKIPLAITRGEAERLIKSELSYDGDRGKKCPHCDRYISTPVFDYDHTSSTSNNIMVNLGVEKGPLFVFIKGSLYDYLEAAYPVGPDNKDKDTESVVDFIEEYLEFKES